MADIFRWKSPQLIIHEPLGIILKMEKSELWIKVDKILWEDWDPIGVNDNGAPDDEYRGYIPSIIKLIIADADESKITKLLHQHANMNMGLSTKIADHAEIARKLKSLTN